MKKYKFLFRDVEKEIDYPYSIWWDLPEDVKSHDDIQVFMTQIVTEMFGYEQHGFFYQTFEHHFLFIPKALLSRFIVAFVISEDDSNLEDSF